MLNRKTYFIREHVGFLKLSDVFDILDPETGEQIGVAKEKPNAFIHVLRFFVNKPILLLAAGLAVDIIYKEK